MPFHGCHPGALHGYGIARAIRDSSAGKLDIEFGSLYPALKRLEQKGCVSSEWENSASNRRANYQLTPQGREQLVEQQSRWGEFVNAVARVMGPAPDESKL